MISVPSDPLNYRIAFAEAFRSRGILADKCLSMSPDNLLWESPEQLLGTNLLDVKNIEEIKLDLVPYYARDDVIRSSEKNRYTLWEWLTKPDKKRPAIDRAWEKALGVYFVLPKKRNLNSIFLGRKPAERRWREPAVEVHSVRTTRRS